MLSSGQVGDLASVIALLPLEIIVRLPRKQKEFSMVVFHSPSIASKDW